ncbi:MAG: rhomboid family intramembrane serine protease [Acidobacteriota bacterium]|nr:rhomboid family intramembrane serine protease [Acidobacteriota bacterium]
MTNRDGIKVRAAALGTVVGAMWIVRVLDALVPGMGSAAGHGIIPRTWVGLEGIPIAPLIHANWGHLLANTIPLIILGGLVLLRGVSEFVFVALVSGLIGGAGTWLFGASNTHHIGASGVVFGLFGYLLFRTAFDRRWSSAIVTLIVALAYGTAMASALIPTDGVSWSGHTFGFLGGVIAARIRYPNGPRRATSGARF